MSAGAGIPVAHDDVPVGELTAADDALANRVLVQGDFVPLLDGLEVSSLRIGHMDLHGLHVRKG